MRIASTIVAADVPAEWQWKESVTIVAPDQQTNVIASSEPMPAGMDLRGFADSQGELLRSQLPGFAEVDLSPSPAFGQADGFVRTFQWNPPESLPVTQIQIYAVVSGRGYTATATATTDTFGAAKPALLALLASLTVRAD